MDLNTKICLFVCAFAAAREFRPVEPFFAEFLIGPDVGFSEKQAVQDILVITAYSSFVLVIVVFLITDFLRYKPIIIADGVAGIMTYVLLLGRPSVRTMQIEQIFYSFFYSSDTAYYTYMYAKIQDKTTYNKITGYVRACVLSGKFVSGCVSQIFVSLVAVGSSKLPLVYMSIGGMSVCTLLSFFFPPVKHTFYFHRRSEPEPISPPPLAPPPYDDHSPPSQIFATEASAQPTPVKVGEPVSVAEKPERLEASQVIRYFWADFKSSFSNQKVIVWAFWWGVAGAGSNLVLSYCQVIWKEVIDENHQNMLSMNGIVDCVYTGLSAVAAYGVGQLNVDWTLHSNLFLTVGSLCIGVLVLLTSQLKNIYAVYLCHVLFGLSYNTMLTVAEFEIAKEVKESCYGLVFGFIQFTAILLTTIWTAIIVEDTFFTFNIKRQFELCALYFLAIGIYYLMMTVQSVLRRRQKLI